MRIGFDARYISHGLTGGVRTYVYQLAKELPRAAPEHEFFFYADTKAPFELPNVPDNVVTRMLPWNGPVSSIQNDLFIGRHMERDRVDVIHCPGNYGPKVNVPLVVTLMDTLNLFPMREHLRGFGRRPRQVALMMYLGWKTRASLAHATQLVTLSHHAQQDIARTAGFPLDRITVTYGAAAEEFHLIEDEGILDAYRSRHDLRRSVILADGIKNPQATIEAFASLPEHIRRRTDLVFFSRESNPRPAVAAVIGDPSIRFIAQPTITELAVLMNLAAVFAFPSWYEGFGLPLVEAMHCGLPIVASSRASIPEIVGDAGLIFDLEAADQFSAHLCAMLENDGMRNDFRAKAIARSGRFSWRKTAERTIEVYESVSAVGARRIA